jgi:hypothetical protein
LKKSPATAPLEATIWRSVSKREICAPPMNNVIRNGGAPPSGMRRSADHQWRKVTTTRATKPISNEVSPQTQYSKAPGDWS